MAVKTVTKVLDTAIENAADMAKNSGLVTEAWQERLTAKTPAQKKEAEKTAAEGWVKLIAIPAKRTINMINAAYHIGNSNINLTEEDVAQAIEVHEKHATNQNLTNDSIYKGLLNCDSKNAKIAVIIEPTYKYNETQLGFGSKYYAAAAMHSLIKHKLPYIPLDIRSLTNKEAPSPREIPLIIMPCRSTPCHHCTLDAGKIIKALAKYEQAGGKILQIGQTPISIFKSMRRDLQKIDRKDTSVMDNIVGSKLETTPTIGGKTSSSEITITPYTRNGWHKPYLKAYFKHSDENLIPCVTLKQAGQTHILGMYQKIDGRVRNCFLPELSLIPYILPEQYSADVSKATFDQIGDKFFINVIHQLMR